MTERQRGCLVFILVPVIAFILGLALEGLLEAVVTRLSPKDKYI